MFIGNVYDSFGFFLLFQVKVLLMYNNSFNFQLAELKFVFTHLAPDKTQKQNLIQRENKSK